MAQNLAKLKHPRPHDPFRAKAIEDRSKRLRPTPPTLWKDREPFTGTCANGQPIGEDRKSTRLNSSHPSISYAVFCLKKKTRQMTTSTTSIDIMGLQAAYSNLHTDQERDYFMQRYHDVISSFGGKTSYDADNRPLLVMRSNLWASGYDVDGTDQTSLGQFSGRVQQTFFFFVMRRPPRSTLFPYTTLFR